MEEIKVNEMENQTEETKGGLGWLKVAAIATAAVGAATALAVGVYKKAKRKATENEQVDEAEDLVPEAEVVEEAPEDGE